VLASSSPQREALLRRLGVRFSVRAPAARELADGEPRTVALENARRKARAAAGARGDELIIGCDTIVALGRTIYGKPADEREARRTLAALSGVTHEVVSGLTVLGPAGAERSALAGTSVTFRELDGALLDWYLARGEWRERAGGYAIQGAGAALVREVRGDYENVVGLPLAALLDLCPELLAGQRRRVGS
jgi:septum formation protein